MTVGAGGFGTGFVYLMNPLGSTKVMAIRRIEVHSVLQGTNVAAVNTPPIRITAARLTITGGALTGASLNPTAIDTSGAAPTGLTTSASTGLTMTTGTTVYSFLLAGAYLQGATLPTTVAAPTCR